MAVPTSLRTTADFAIRGIVRVLFNLLYLIFIGPAKQVGTRSYLHLVANVVLLRRSQS